MSEKEIVSVSPKNGYIYFRLEKIVESSQLSEFDCSIEEYNEYLRVDALRSQKDHVAFTWLLRDFKNNGIAAYMSLIADAIKISATEKDLHGLNYPFKTIPAVKIAKLAVSSSAKMRYSGIGSFMVNIASDFARTCNESYIAARFITVDADIEHNANVLDFYKKNGFLLNDELFNKNRKTVSMRKDIYS